MSIFATILSIEHPGQWVADGAQARVARSGNTGNDTPERELGSPWIYQGSHVLPAVSDSRGGWVELACIPDHVTRDDGTGRHDWLRVTVGVSMGELGTVLVDRAQVTAIRDALSEWLGGGERS